MFANTQMMGVDTGFPDVCKTPSPGGPVPMTYPNGTYEVKNSASKSSVKSTYSGSTVTSGNKVKMTSGDEAGTMKGVVSSVTMGNLLGNAPLLMRLVDKAHAKGYKVIITVKAEGKAVVSLQNTPLYAGRTTSSSSTQSIRGSSGTYHARSGTEGMEWLLRRLG